MEKKQGQRHPAHALCPGKASRTLHLLKGTMGIFFPLLFSMSEYSQPSSIRTNYELLSAREEAAYCAWHFHTKSSEMLFFFFSFLVGVSTSQDPLHLAVLAFVGLTILYDGHLGCQQHLWLLLS